jgi:16S rRNA (uracil1498-N3)-methyltransferase
MTPRFYAPALEHDLGLVRLPDQEAAHLTRVMRLVAGDKVRVFDGRGFEAEGRVASIHRGEVVIEPSRAVEAAPETRVALTLAQAVLKADKLDDVVRDAVMLGVSAIQPLLTSRTDVPPRAFKAQLRVDRWQRIAVASSKQCGRAVVADLRQPCTLAECLALDRSVVRVLLTEPAASAAATPLDELRHRPVPPSALLIVGPEGGWSGEEVELADRHGCVIVTLGRRTLRADAAPLVALSVLEAVWGEL